MTRLQAELNEVESRQPVEWIEKQVQRQEDQLKSMHESSALLKQDYQNTCSKLWRKEKDLSNCQLDKRILERELKETVEKMNSLKTEMESLRISHADERKAHEKDLNDVRELKIGLNEELFKIKLSLKDVEKSSSEYRAKWEEAEGKVVVLKNELETAQKTMVELITDKELDIKVRRRLQVEKRNLEDDLATAKLEAIESKNLKMRFERESDSATLVSCDNILKLSIFHMLHLKVF